MAGLNFYTQTIINSNVDADSNGKALFTSNNGIMHVKRDFIFTKDNVKVIRKRSGYDAEPCSVTIDFDNIVESNLDLFDTLSDRTGKLYCRLDIYLGVEGAEPFIYSTPWVQKGIPFWVEFVVDQNNSGQIAKHVADMIKSNNLFQVDKDLLNVEIDGNSLILTGATEYQRFRNVEVNVFAPHADEAIKIASLKDGDFEENYVYGKNGFGTYSQIVKDLRLPTAENYQWTHIRQAETPVVGAIYNQYIIECVAPASNEGLGAVGQQLESHTTHVFWVKNDEDLIRNWETSFDAVDLLQKVELFEDETWQQVPR